MKNFYFFICEIYNLRCPASKLSNKADLLLRGLPNHPNKAVHIFLATDPESPFIIWLVNCRYWGLVRRTNQSQDFLFLVTEWPIYKLYYLLGDSVRRCANLNLLGKLIYYRLMFSFICLHANSSFLLICPACAQRQVIAATLDFTTVSAHIFGYPVYAIWVFKKMLHKVLVYHLLNLSAIKWHSLVYCRLFLKFCILLLLLHSFYIVDNKSQSFDT